MEGVVDEGTVEAADGLEEGFVADAVVEAGDEVAVAEYGTIFRLLGLAKLVTVVDDCKLVPLAEDC